MVGISANDRTAAMLVFLGLASALLLRGAVACIHDSCYGPVNMVEHVRHVKRMQPGALDAAYGPKGPLEWGQINFLHTTDTHGWLQGHLKERNYGADWGDFVTFTRLMKQAASDRGVDLLLVDTGDLHDGTGLSDATEVNGAKSMPIFDEIDYDLLAIGNHELYVSEVSYQIFNDYARQWGDRYVTSNVKVFNKTSGEYEYMGVTHRYFTTARGLRIMAFGVLFDFAGNSNASQVLKASEMVEQRWFAEALRSRQPVDLFVIVGHNPVRPTDRFSTFKTVVDAIRKLHPNTPIQIFGGHTHIRDFAVYDDAAVALESGRYCETLGWASMSGFNASNSGFRGPANPRGVKNPTRPAREGSEAPFTFSRRYLDWNRKTFIYHSSGDGGRFDHHSGQRVTSDITRVRQELRLGDVYGCAPQDWCYDCAPFDDASKNIFPGLIVPAASATVVNKKRANRARIIIGNPGSVRFDVHKGPFTSGDSHMTIPYRDVFFYIADVAFDKADKVIKRLNQGRAAKRALATMAIPRDECTDPSLGYRSQRDVHEERGIVRRQEVVVPGYVTSDDWGTDGDDTKHTGIPSYTIPKYWEARASFPEGGSNPGKVDLIFFDFLKGRILQMLGTGYTDDMVHCYMGCNFTSQDFLLPYAELKWQANKHNCPVM